MSGSGILLLFLTSSVIFLVLGLALVLYVMQYQKRMTRQSDEMKNRENEYQKQLVKALIEGQEKERSRIAANLHDSLGAILSATKLKVLLHGEDHPESEAFAQETAQLLSDGITEVREITHNLLPSHLSSFGLPYAVNKLAEKLNASGGIHVMLKNDWGDYRLSEEAELALYRVCQEMLNNTLKHAHATEIQIRFTQGENGHGIEYHDNGDGFDVERVYDGLGIYTIKSRIQAVNGELYIDSQKGKGASFNIVVPEFG